MNVYGRFSRLAPAAFWRFWFAYGQSGLVTNRVYSATQISLHSVQDWVGGFLREPLAFIEREKIPGQIFNSYSEGGFFTWRLGTKYGDYIDGRGSPFGMDLVERNIRLMGSLPDSPDWQAGG